jgi:tRNA1Val (adenine37-N6)-methyltransferase
MSLFHFKHFSIDQSNCAMKIGTDALVFGAWVSCDNSPKNCLDIGTGTGVLSLMMAQKYPNTKITALELDKNASETAQFNFQNNKIGQNCISLYQDVLTYTTLEKFDLIVSNPPFFEKSTKSTNSTRTTARHTDSLPLEKLFEKGTELLSDNGVFALVLPADSMERFLKGYQGLFPVRVLYVYGKQGSLTRICAVFSKYQSEMISTDLVIRNEDGTYTDAYKELTIDFHGVVL